MRATSQSGAAREKIEALEQKLRQIHLTAGRLVLSMPPTGAESEVLAIRAEIADAASERDRLRGEGRRLVDDTWTQVRAWVTPRAPALGTMLVAWLIARGYAVSHTAAILASVGLSHTKRGSHLVNLTADTFLVRHILPLVAALLCGYAAHRIAGRVRTSLETVRAQSAARLAARSEASEPPARGASQRSAHARRAVVPTLPPYSRNRSRIRFISSGLSNCNQCPVPSTTRCGMPAPRRCMLKE